MKVELMLMFQFLLPVCHTTFPSRAQLINKKCPRSFRDQNEVYIYLSLRDLVISLN